MDGNIRVGFIGLGLMGEPMARNILKKGFELTVYNRTANKALAFKKLGAKVASILSEVPAASFFMKLKMPNMVKNKFPTTFSLSNMRKDLNLALSEVEKTKGKLPILALVDKLYKKGISLGFGQQDLSAIIKVLSSQ